MPFSDSGCPQFRPEDGAKLEMILAIDDTPPDRDETLKHVVLQGNRQGLRAFASAILALSESDDPYHHIHIDEEVSGHAYRNREGYSITLQKLKN